MKTQIISNHMSQRLIKKMFNIVGIFVFSIVLFGCATTQDRGSGVVLSVQKVPAREVKSHEGAKTGAVIGGVIGATGGAATGGLVGLIWGAFGEATTPLLITTILGGAVVGAVFVGGAGVVAGAGLGHIVDVSKAHAGYYQFIVKPDNADKTITVTQYSSIIPSDTRVYIYEKNDTIFIKQK